MKWKDGIPDCVPEYYREMFENEEGPEDEPIETIDEMYALVLPDKTYVMVGIERTWDGNDYVPSFKACDAMIPVLARIFHGDGVEVVSEDWITELHGSVEYWADSFGFKEL